MWHTGLVARWHVGSSRTRARTRVPCVVPPGKSLSGLLKILLTSVQITSEVTSLAFGEIDTQTISIIPGFYVTKASSAQGVEKFPTFPPQSLSHCWYFRAKTVTPFTERPLWPRCPPRCWEERSEGADGPSLDPLGATWRPPPFQSRSPKMSPDIAQHLPGGQSHLWLRIPGLTSSQGHENKVK